MKIHLNTNCISAEVHACIESLPIPLIKSEPEEGNLGSIININICWNPASATSETYKLSIYTFENGKPEEFLALVENFKTAIDGTGTRSVPVWVNYLRTMLYGEAQREFDKSASQFSGTKNAHLKFIREGLLGYFPLINALSNHKHAMCHTMCKP